VRIIVLLTFAMVLQGAAFAQKTQDPEARNKRAVSVSPTRPTNPVQAHRSQPSAPTVPKSGSVSAQDLAKVERASVQRMKTTHKTNTSSKSGSTAAPVTQPQTKSKPMKFSYHPPPAAGKTISGKNPPPPPVRSRPETH
jgi:hypothetical protein